jgi:hypothetical protein
MHSKYHMATLLFFFFVFTAGAGEAMPKLTSSQSSDPGGGRVAAIPRAVCGDGGDAGTVRGAVGSDGTYSSCSISGSGRRRITDGDGSGAATGSGGD